MITSVITGNYCKAEVSNLYLYAFEGKTMFWCEKMDIFVTLRPLDVVYSLLRSFEFSFPFDIFITSTKKMEHYQHFDPFRSAAFINT